MKIRDRLITGAIVISIFISAAIKSDNKKETIQEVKAAIASNNNGKDSIYVTIDVKNQQDTIVYNDGIFVKYPKEIELEIKIAKGTDKNNEIIVYNKTFAVQSNKE